MIRLTPKTSDGKGFDPVACMVVGAYRVLKQLGVKRVTIHYDETKAVVPVDGLYHPTFPEDIMRKIVSCERCEFEVRAEMVSASGHFTFILKNDLVTVPATPSKVDGMTNGDFGRLQLCYPEALAPARMRSEVEYDNLVANGFPTVYGGRPYYAVILSDIVDTILTFHGPAVTNTAGKYFMTDTQSVQGSKIDIYTLDPDYRNIPVVEKKNAEVDIVPNDGERRDNFGVYFTNESFGREPLVFSQAAQFIDGRILNFVDYLRALQIAAFIEASPTESLYDNDLVAGDVVLIPVERLGGRWYLGEKANNFWKINCAENMWIKNLFQYIKSTDNEIYLSDEKGAKRGSISKVPDSQACYALSYAYCIAAGTGGRFGDMIAALQDTIDGGGLRTDGSYILSDSNVWGQFTTRNSVGEVFTVEKTGFGLATKSAKRGASYVSNFTIDTLKEKVGENGLFILGYDPNLLKPANNRPDHFIVCRLKGNRIIVEFDPYRVEGSATYARAGSDVTSSAASFNEACVHILRFVK